MPLPEPKTPWPPPMYTEHTRNVTAWSAWWSGDPDELADHYGGTVDRTTEGSWSSRRTGLGGLACAAQRMFWGQRTSSGEQRSKPHMPLAQEIAQVSADLLFGAPPSVKIPKRPGSPASSATAENPRPNPTQARLEALLGEETHDLLYDAAEACAALGHVYLRVGWDKDLNPDGPLLSMIDADMAFPKYRNRVLTEVMFLSEWVDGTEVMRHLEHHEPGYIEHALYLGTFDNLGRRIPLAEIPELADLMDGAVEVDGRHVIETGVDVLDVVGVANARARSRKARRAVTIRDIGRADIPRGHPLPQPAVAEQRRAHDVPWLVGVELDDPVVRTRTQRRIDTTVPAARLVPVGPVDEVPPGVADRRDRR